MNFSGGISKLLISLAITHEPALFAARLKVGEFSDLLTYTNLGVLLDFKPCLIISQFNNFYLEFTCENFTKFGWILHD